jgi:hypothetical protein
MSSAWRVIDVIVPGAGGTLTTTVASGASERTAAPVTALRPLKSQTAA